MKIEESTMTAPAASSYSSQESNAGPIQRAAESVGRYRWTICALLFFGTTMNYVDRQVLGLLAPELQTKIGWSEAHYGYIVTAFQAAYAIGLLLMGRLIDIVGTRIGYALSIV